MSPWWNWRHREHLAKESAEVVRKEQGKLAVAVVSLDHKRHDLERLMLKMLAETHGEGRT